MPYQFPCIRFKKNVSEIQAFIKNNNFIWGGLLNKIHYARVVQLAEFQALINHLNIANQDHVGVISGNETEYELKLLNIKKTSFLIYEENHDFDLDASWEKQEPKEFSFTICNQVFEHIYNPTQGIKNLIHHTRPGGYIWLSIPTINGIHGEPFFYSAGYHPRFLERLATENGLEVISIGWWGSYKMLVNAVSTRWLNVKQLKPGFHRFYDFMFPFLCFVDGRRQSKKYITDTWVLMRKPSAR